MTLIEELENAVLTDHSRARTVLDRPLHQTGFWSLAIKDGDRHVIVEWQQGGPPYASSARDDGYGEGGDEIFETVNEARKRVNELLRTGERTVTPMGSLLSCARERDCLTQGEIAERLGVKQATVSGIERRHDIQISTVRRYLGALNSPFEVRIYAQTLTLRPVSNSESLFKSTHIFCAGDVSFPRLSGEGKLSKANEDAQRVSHTGSIFEFA